MKAIALDPAGDRQANPTLHRIAVSTVALRRPGPARACLLPEMPQAPAGSDLLVSGRCPNPNCGKALSSLLVPTRTGDLVQNDYLALLGALSVLVGLAMATGMSQFGSSATTTAGDAPGGQCARRARDPRAHGVEAVGRGGPRGLRLDGLLLRLGLLNPC